jgi:hypothetical protein
MKIHLIADEMLSKELYTRVLDLLKAVPGVNQFFAKGTEHLFITQDGWEEQLFEDKETFEKKQFAYPPTIMESMSNKVFENRIWRFPHTRTAVGWTEIFQNVQSYRKKYRIPENEFAILLTPTANKKNWFALLDENNPFNGFIHTDEWEHFIACDPAFPIAFEVIALALQKNIFKSYSEIMERTHVTAIGCVSDLCMKKSDIILKMRTADICPTCMEKVQERLSLPEIHHALGIMESLRVKMLFAQNFRQNSPPSRMVIRRNGKIFLPDYENLEIKITPLDKALYLLFLRHPEGLYLSSLNEHRQELLDIYVRFARRGMMEDIRRRINDLTNALHPACSIAMSKIKASFTTSLGDSLSEHYIIQGENAERRNIRLDRSLVEDLVNV